jgi:hypothetical protein
MEELQEWGISRNNSRDWVHLYRHKKGQLALDNSLMLFINEQHS